jgi:hypothetical protein
VPQEANAALKIGTGVRVLGAGDETMSKKNQTTKRDSVPRNNGVCIAPTGYKAVDPYDPSTLTRLIGQCKEAGIVTADMSDERTATRLLQVGALVVDGVHGYRTIIDIKEAKQNADALALLEPNTTPDMCAIITDNGLSVAPIKNVAATLRDLGQQEMASKLETKSAGLFPVVRFGAPGEPCRLNILPTYKGVPAFPGAR